MEKVELIYEYLKRMCVSECHMLNGKELGGCEFVCTFCKVTYHIHVFNELKSGHAPRLYGDQVFTCSQGTCTAKAKYVKQPNGALMLEDIDTGSKVFDAYNLCAFVTERRILTRVLKQNSN